MDTNEQQGVQKDDKYLYELKDSLVTKSELSYFQAIKDNLPEKYILQPQINLSSVIKRTDSSYYHNELFRNIDAGIFDKETYKPLVLIEINDDSHNRPDRRKRDIKVKMICEEAGIPLITFWTKYGVNVDYISRTVKTALEQSENPVRQTHDWSKTNINNPKTELTAKTDNSIKGKEENKSEGGCYIATSVYGSYDCPEVWTLRRFRDRNLSAKWYGRLFIRIYYSISPSLVKHFGHTKCFQRFWKKHLDKLVVKLQNNGFENTPYNDYNK
ncbi:MAG: CFI-box-CTERM domain-containing protein [Acutalibacteraceae bacterium]